MRYNVYCYVGWCSGGVLRKLATRIPPQVHGEAIYTGGDVVTVSVCQCVSVCHSVPGCVTVSRRITRYQSI